MNRVSGLLRLGLGLVGASFPERTKRLIFLASFSARLRDQDSFDRETVHKLNEVMALASNEQSINLPVHLSKVIWRDRVIHDLATKDVLSTPNFSKEGLQDLVERVLEAMPAWLRYAEGKMREDIVRLLNHKSVLIGA